MEPMTIPSSVAVCPKCGRSVSLMDVSGCVLVDDEWIPDEISVECDGEPEMGAVSVAEYNDWVAWHYMMPYVDWLPIHTKVLVWLRNTYRVDDSKAGGLKLIERQQAKQADHNRQQAKGGE